MKLALGVDVGGTKLAAGLVDSAGVVQAHARTATDNSLGPEGLWLSLRLLIDRLITDAGSPELLGTGIGCGGPMLWPAGIVSPLNISAWRDFPLLERMSEAFGAPATLINDAIALAIAEHWVGSAVEVDNFLGVVVSTGVGGGLILGGQVVPGVTGNAGHIGHVIADPTGPVCACGAVGCVEAIASGPGLAAWARANGWTPTGVASAQALADDARAGDIVALAALARAGTAIGIGLAAVAAICDIDLVVVGGGVAQAGNLLLDPVRTSFARHAGMGYVRRVRIERSGLGGDAGVIGAAAMVHRPDRYWPLSHPA